MNQNDPVLRQRSVESTGKGIAACDHTPGDPSAVTSAWERAEAEPLETRCYGDSGLPVVVVHGGPGAAGYMAPVARRLAGEYQVIEPLQRCSSSEPLTVRRHVDDLRRVIEIHCRGRRPALVGHSWGAMLVLAFAASCPGFASSIALVGCGTFDARSRTVLEQTIRDRMTPAVRERLKEASRRIRDPDVRLCVVARILEPLYSCELVPHEDETAFYDSQGQRETWSDMLRLQRAGTYPAAFAGIREPLLMLHGDLDPHPGSLIRDALLPFVPHLEYVGLPRCGHYPWLERHACEAFFGMLTAWLAGNDP